MAPHHHFHRPSPRQDIASSNTAATTRILKGAFKRTTAEHRVHSTSHRCLLLLLLLLLGQPPGSTWYC
jgi:hypothetical protein